MKQHRLTCHSPSPSRRWTQIDHTAVHHPVHTRGLRSCFSPCLLFFALSVLSHQHEIRPSSSAASRLTTVDFSPGRSFQCSYRHNKIPRVRVNIGTKSRKPCTQQQLLRRTPGNVWLRKYDVLDFSCSIWRLQIRPPDATYNETRVATWDVIRPRAWEMTTGG